MCSAARSQTRRMPHAAEIYGVLSDGAYPVKGNWKIGESVAFKKKNK